MKTFSLLFAVAVLSLSSCDHSQVHMDTDSDVAQATSLAPCCADAQKLGKDCAGCKED